MKIFYNSDHVLHHGKAEFNEGEMVPCFEKPERVQFIVDELKRRNFNDFNEPHDCLISDITAVHGDDYIEFLQSVWQDWTAVHGNRDAFPMVSIGRGLRNIKPKDIDGIVSYYAFDPGSPITEGTWQAVYKGASTAIEASRTVSQLSSADMSTNKKTSFALTRPPGHHAHSDQYGGYCFINNAAVAAQWLINNGHKKVTIFDIDYHHGNGTQDIFYHRDDVQFLSIHADPAHEFPYFLGYEDEVGEGQGKGYNHNYALPWGTDWNTWSTAMNDAIAKITDYQPEILVISLGVDTYKDDPISQFSLDSPHFIEMGKAIAKLNLPTVFIMEGGYATEAIGVNVANVLEGFMGNSPD